MTTSILGLTTAAHRFSVFVPLAPSPRGWFVATIVGALTTAGLLSNGCASERSGVSSDESNFTAADAGSSQHVAELATANSAQRIEVAYQPGSTSTTTTTETFGEQVSIRVSGLPPSTRAVRAVLVDDCSAGGGSNPEQAVLQCDLESTDGRWSVEVSERRCRSLQQPPDLASEFPRVLMSRNTSAHLSLFCSQEISIASDSAPLPAQDVPGERFLVDPISGTHNFKFKMQFP